MASGSSMPSCFNSAKAMRFCATEFSNPLSRRQLYSCWDKSPGRMGPCPDDDAALKCAAVMAVATLKLNDSAKPTMGKKKEPSAASRISSDIPRSSLPMTIQMGRSVSSLLLLLLFLDDDAFQSTCRISLDRSVKSDTQI
eukprot:scaffold91_cov173-Amphora_coffeaeformis.AAC.2